MTPPPANTALRRHTSHWGVFQAEVRDGRIVGIHPFERDPDPSPIIQSIPHAVYAESRVRRPMIRKGWLESGPESRGRRGAEPFVAVPWDEALDMVASELDRIRKDFGNAAIFGGSYGWSSAGRFHHAKTQIARFLNCIGGHTGQVQNYSYAAAGTLLPHLVGTADVVRGLNSDYESMEGHTDLFVSFGGVPMKNMQVEAGGSGEHDGAVYLQRLRDGGTKFLNIGPIRDGTAGVVDVEWQPIRPNTDTALMLGLAFTLRDENLHDPAFLERYCTGYPRFERYLLGADDGQPKTADWAAEITGIPAETIRLLARRMAGGRTFLNATWSLQRADHGEQPYWMMITLAAMLGQIGLRGGGFGFGFGSMNGVGCPRRPFGSPSLPTGQNQTRSFIPVSRIVDMLLNPGATYQFDGAERVYPETRMIYWCGGNPFHHHQDINRMIEGWRRPDTVVVHEPWWTSTARHADIVLPATTTLERNDISIGSRDRFVTVMEQAVEPVGEARNDFDIFTALAQRLGVADSFTEGRDEAAWLRHLYEVSRKQAQRNGVDLPEFDTFWTQGYAEIPKPDEPFIMLGDFRADPVANALKTPSGKIEIFSENIDNFGYDDCPGHAVWLEPLEWLGSPLSGTFPLHMVSSQPKHRLHGQMDDTPVSAAAKIQGREPVLMNPGDAAARDIEDGMVVRVFNDRGAVLAGARISDGVMPGVIELCTGAWYDPLHPGEIGTLDVHGNANVLTPDKGTSKLTQAPSAHSVLVQVERYEGNLPPVSVFLQPPTVEIASVNTEGGRRR